MVFWVFLPTASGAQPSPDEQNQFNQVRARMEGHAAQMPRSVGDVSSSFSDACWGMSFFCPREAPRLGVTFVVCTRLVAWRANQADAAEAAAYIWDATPASSTANNIKTIRYDNELMIDSTVFGPNEGLGDLGETLNEGLLYHEFLHGQLGIDWLKTQAPAACQCRTPDPGPHSDPGHGQIPDLQDRFIESLAGLEDNTVEIKRPRVPASPDRTFTITLCRKNGWTGTVRNPANSNIANPMVSDPRDDGSIVLTGSLVDPERPGSVMVLVDPDAHFVYAFVTVAPANQLLAIPALADWGLLTFAALLLLAGLLALGRSRLSG